MIKSNNDAFYHQALFVHGTDTALSSSYCLFYSFQGKVMLLWFLLLLNNRIIESVTSYSTDLV
jgi:hypothetical protein